MARHQPVQEVPGLSQPSSLTRAVFGALFVLLIAVALWVPIYNRVEPTLAGVPFFYWFQVFWIVVTAVVTALAYRVRL
jgi:hypothetical protein